MTALARAAAALVLTAAGVVVLRLVLGPVLAGLVLGPALWLAIVLTWATLERRWLPDVPAPPASSPSPRLERTPAAPPPVDQLTAARAAALLELADWYIDHRPTEAYR